MTGQPAKHRRRERRHHAAQAEAAWRAFESARTPSPQTCPQYRQGVDLPR